MHSFVMLNIWMVRLERQKRQQIFFYQPLNLCFIFGFPNIIVVRIYICRLIIAKVVTESKRQSRAEVLLDVEKVPQRKLPQALVKLVQCDNILKRRTITIISSRRIFKKIFISANQRKIPDSPKRIFCTVPIRNDQVLVPHLLQLLVIGHKWLRHIITFGYEKRSPRRDSPGHRPHKHLQPNH